MILEWIAWLSPPFTRPVLGSRSRNTGRRTTLESRGTGIDGSIISGIPDNPPRIEVERESTGSGVPQFQNITHRQMRIRFSKTRNLDLAKAERSARRPPRTKRSWCQIRQYSESGSSSRLPPDRHRPDWSLADSCRAPGDSPSHPRDAPHQSARRSGRIFIYFLHMEISMSFIPIISIIQYKFFQFF